MSFLANLLKEIIEGTSMVLPDTHRWNGHTYSKYSLPGGAELWWSTTNRQLMALRVNAVLQTNEASTFEKYIKTAGYAHKPRAVVSVDGSLNDRYGVAWVILDPSKPEDNPTQESLFDAGGDPKDKKA